VTGTYTFATGIEQLTGEDGQPSTAYDAQIRSPELTRSQGGAGALFGYTTIRNWARQTGLITVFRFVKRIAQLHAY
jgi:hypothetical protein